MNITRISWKSIIKPRKKLWAEAYDVMHERTQGVSALMRNFAKLSWHFGIPAAVKEEAAEVANYLRVPLQAVMAAQVVYDEGWGAEAFAPGHGCTSVSSRSSFGRNLDYSFPDNAADYVYEDRLQLAGVTLRTEMFAGLLGWLAYAGPTSAASFNQAPRLRSIRRTHVPALVWFRQHSLLLEKSTAELARDGDIWTDHTAADCLLHFEKNGRRFLAEKYDSQLVWQLQAGRSVQANTYQLIDLKADKHWEADSTWRMRQAAKSKTVKSGLAAASNEWTIDTFMMRNNDPASVI